MSMARLVITAVTIEGRSKSEVAREYGVSRVWVQKLIHRFEADGEAAFEPRSRRPHSNPYAVDLGVEEQIVRLRKQLSKDGLDAGAEIIAAHLQSNGVGPVPAVSRSGGSCLGAGLWSVSRRHGPGSAGTGSAPSSPTNAGRPISLTGGSPTGPRWRS